MRKTEKPYENVPLMRGEQNERRRLSAANSIERLYEGFFWNSGVLLVECRAGSLQTRHT